MIKKFIVFSCVNTAGTLAQFITLTVLVELLTIAPVLASDTGMTLGAVINYFLSRSLAFNSTAPYRKTMLKFFIVAFIGLLFNSTIMHMAVQHMPYLLAQIVTTSTVVFWNFLAHHYWTFSPKHAC